MRPWGRPIGRVYMILGPLLVVGAFLAYALMQFRALPLQELDPDLYEQIVHADPSATLQETREFLDEVQGVDADLAPEGATVGETAYSTTWLSANDADLVVLLDAVSRCEAEWSTVHAYTDPAQWLVARAASGHRDGIPVVGLADVKTAYGQWTASPCLSDIRSAQTGVPEKLEKAKDAAALDAVTPAWDQAKTELDTAISAAQNTYDTSAGQVQDEATRESLSATLAAARDLSAQAIPTTWEEVESATPTLQSMIGSLETSGQAVTDSVAAQAAAEKAAAEKAAAEKAAAQKASSTSTPTSTGTKRPTSSKPSGGTTTTKPAPTTSSGSNGSNGCAYFGCGTGGYDSGRPQATG